MEEKTHKKDTIIRVENLHKTFHTASGDFEIIKGIDLEIGRGDFCIIYGPSGCGKSTLLHHLVGLEVPSRGKVFVRGTEISKLTAEERAVFRSKKIGMVYQIWYWVKSLNVWENVALPLLIAGESVSFARKAAMKSLEQLEITKYADKNPMQLSGGEQQRVGIARALVNDPWIIIADEPTGNLDTHASDQVMSLLNRLNNHDKRTVIMVTHNLIYLQMATMEVAMKDGQVVAGRENVQDQIRKDLAQVL